jgi:hypothetical protein
LQAAEDQRPLRARLHAPARNIDVSQRAASVRDALERIGAKREAEGKKRAAPAAKSTKSAKTAAASADLTELLRNVGPDEVRDALRAADWEPAALRELRQYIDEGPPGDPVWDRLNPITAARGRELKAKTLERSVSLQTG